MSSCAGNQESAPLIVLSVLGSFLSLVQPAMMSGLIDSLGEGRDAVVVLLCLVLVFVTGAVTAGLKAYLSTRFSENGVVGIRRTLISRLLCAPVPTLSSQSAAELSARVVNDPPFLTQGVVALMSGSVASTITCAGASAACLYLFSRRFSGCVRVRFCCRHPYRSPRSQDQGPQVLRPECDRRALR